MTKQIAIECENRVIFSFECIQPYFGDKSWRYSISGQHSSLKKAVAENW